MTQPRKQVVSGTGVPAVIGPYSAGVRAGELLFVSGQGGIDPATGALGATDPPARMTMQTPLPGKVLISVLRGTGGPGRLGIEGRRLPG